MFPSHIAHIISDLVSANQIAAQITPATLYNHERLAVRGTSFPAVAKSAAVYMWKPMTEVDGQLVFDLTDSPRKDLDDYEGGLYNLMPVLVWAAVEDELDARDVVEAELYVWAGSRDDLVAGCGEGVKCRRAPG